MIHLAKAGGEDGRDDFLKKTNIIEWFKSDGL